MKRKITFLIAALFALTLITQSFSASGQTRAKKVEDFEKQSAGSTYNSTQSYTTSNSNCSIAWSVYYGTVSTTDKINGSKSVQMRWYSTATSNTGYLKSTTAIPGLKSIKFKAKVNNTDVKMEVQYSANGSSWTTIQNASAVTFSAASTAYDFEYNIPSGGQYIKIGISSSSTAPSSGHYRFTVDDIEFTRSYAITYKAGEGTGEDVVETKTEEVNYTILGKPDGFTAPVGKVFNGWKDANNTSYAAGDIYTTDAALTLTAQWITAGNYITISPTTKNVEAEGGDVEFTISTDQTISTTANEAVQFYSDSDGTVTTSKPSWITSTAYSSVTNKLTVTVAANHTASANGPAYFRVKNTASTTTSAVVTISQAAYSVATPTFTVDAGSYYANQSVEIECETDGVTIYYTTDGTDPTSTSTEYTGAISVTSTTTIKAIAINYGISSSIASATYTLPITISAARSQGTGSVYTRGIVTYVNGKNAYIQDASAAICVYGSSNWSTISAGDDIAVSGSLYTYTDGGGLLEIISPSVTKISSGNAKPCVTKTIAQINTDNFNDLQCMFVQIVKATYDYDDDKVSQGSDEIAVDGTMGEAEDGDVVTFKGNILYYKSGSCITLYNLQDVNVIVEPTISASASIAAPNYVKNATAVNIATKNLAVTGANLESDITATLEDGDESAFEIKVGEGSWGKTATLTESEGSVNANITVRLKAGQNVADYSDRIILESTNATTVNVNITGSVTYAHVAYNGNGSDGGTVPTDNTNYTYNQSVTVDGAGTMTKTGYTFANWNSRSDGTGSTFGASFNITQDTTLYAQWTVNTHSLALPVADAYGTYTADVDDADNVEYGTEVTLTFTPEDGFEDYIAQWYSSDVEIASDGTFTMPDNDVTVKVYMIPNPYIKDVMNCAFTGVTSTSYTSWTGKTGTSGAVYAGVTTTDGKSQTYLQMNTGNSNRGIIATTSGGKIRKISISWYVDPGTKVVTVYGKNTAYETTSDLYDNNKKGISLGTLTKTNTTLLISDDYAYIGLHASGAVYINEFDIFWEYVLPTAAGALTEDATIAENLIVHETNLTIPDNLSLTIEGTLIVTGTLENEGDENNIYIADGGQLYANSVVATVAKDIEDANSKDAGDHWYAISSPVNDGTNSSIPVGDVTYLTSGPAGFAYDMFSYDEEHMLWLNQKDNGVAAGFLVMNVGQGYLYRNSGQTLEFPGETNTGNISYTLSKKSEGKLSGFNLLGNPYPHDITLNYLTYTGGGDNLSGCLVLSNQGAWETKLGATDKIHPTQGFLVQSDVDGKVATIHETAQRSRSNNDYIKFIVDNSEYEDVTFALFDKGYGLNKINHRNSELPMLYISHDDKKYAIATMDDDTKSFNLNFKAMTMGMYTLRYNATGEFSYLHIIDRLTGADVDMLTEGEYKFVGTTTDSENRFIVRLAYSSDNEEVNNDIFAYQSGNDIVINGSGELQIFDVTGRMVSAQRVNGVELINLPSRGVYILRLIGTEVQTQKIVVR